MHNCKKKGVVFCVIFIFLGMAYSPISIGFENENDTFGLIEVCLPEFVPSSSWYNATHLDNIDDAVDIVDPEGIIIIHPCSVDKPYYIKREGVLITKPMTIKGMNKEHNVKTIIHGYPSSPYVFSIRSDNVTIENLTICGAAYPGETSSVCGGIIVHEFSDQKEKNINIEKNIIRNNANGIIIVNQNQDNEHCINIRNNTILNNGKNGIAVNDGTAIIYNNSIHHNIQDGISIWSESCVKIENNEIYCNLVGIWNDQGNSNYIANNSVYNNSHDGICFFNAREDMPSNACCEGNLIINNTIKSNGRCGIFLYYSNNNKIYNNTIIKNKNTGIKIEYHIFLNDEHEDRATSVNNTIYHNNFIENGFKGKNNAIDSKNDLTENMWFNETLEQGNYWSDYKDRYVKDRFYEEQYNRNGSWKDGKYGLPYQLFFIYRKYIYCGIYLKNKPKTFDENPMCRPNCWFNDNSPNTPIVTPRCSTAARVNETLIFKVQSVDPNYDDIKYGINWTSIENNSAVDTSTLTVDEWTSYYQSGNSTYIEYNNWTKPGQYYIRVTAMDQCEDDNHDGKSNWSKGLKVDVIDNK